MASPTQGNGIAPHAQAGAAAASAGGQSAMQATLRGAGRGGALYLQGGGEEDAEGAPGDHHIKLRPPAGQRGPAPLAHKLRRRPRLLADLATPAHVRLSLFERPPAEPQSSAAEAKTRQLKHL